MSSHWILNDYGDLISSELEQSASLQEFGNGGKLGQIFDLDRMADLTVCH